MLFGSGKPRVTKHATKDSIAVKYGITQITPSIIAYGATQVSISEFNWSFLLYSVYNAGSVCTVVDPRVAHARHVIRAGRILLQCPRDF